ncbi:MAG: adenosylcobinamide amidohydrolase [Thermodesulfobacteriota bacterium]|nr:adenosylcobinamide amidohydrolase [Thermodesulfobacteriota bacterium]
MKSIIKLFTDIFLTLLVILFGFSPALSDPVKFIDSRGKMIVIEKKPERVVSLVPSISEIIFKLGAGDSIKAVTYHDTFPGEAALKETVGGFFSPSLKAIEALQPDMIFLSSMHEKVIKKFSHGKCTLVDLKTDSISDSYNNIYLLGNIFDKNKNAAVIVAEIKNSLKLIEKKTSLIPESKRKRVLRLMGGDTVMTPGDDSFQNEMIRAAGAIPPVLGRNGDIVVINQEEWRRFNPQVIYGCGGDREIANNLFNRPGWKDVDAIKNRNIFYFPCDLTCRVSTHTGYFVSWLSSVIYADEFSHKENQVLKDRVFKSRRLDLNLDYIKDARILYSHIQDFQHKTLVIHFTQPLSVVSTLEGQRKAIESVGNHYSPPPYWRIGHRSGIRGIRESVYPVIGQSEKNSSFLFTGANMDHLVIQKKRFKQMEVRALVTAGVKSNAIRMSKDAGRYYEPGTINIILLPNMKLTSRAMTRAIISATEAKTTALMDLDIRSSYLTKLHRATGTGTDNIIVVQGQGIRIDRSGGHTKMGELISKAVYDAVLKAIFKQNAFYAGRNIFQRLKERRISIYNLVSSVNCDCMPEKSKTLVTLEAILLDPVFSGFLQSALALSDDYQKGLIDNLSLYNLQCKRIAEKIAGKKIAGLKDLVEIDDVPLVLRSALNALLNGIYFSNNGI